MLDAGQLAESDGGFEARERRAGLDEIFVNLAAETARPASCSAPCAGTLSTT